MPKLKLDHCVIHISDWERSNAFYRDVMGFEVLRRGNGWVFAGIARVLQELAHEDPRIRPVPVRLEPRPLAKRSRRVRGRRPRDRAARSKRDAPSAGTDDLSPGGPWGTEPMNERCELEVAIAAMAERAIEQIRARARDLIQTVEREAGERLRGSRDLAAVDDGTVSVLLEFARAGKNSTNGHSYEVFAYMGPQHEVLKTQSSVNSYAHRYNAFGLRDVVPGPSRTWLMVDGDDKIPSIPSSINDYPDASNNHGADGANATFCDGHAEWIPRRKYLEVYETSQDENRTTP